MKKSKLNYLIIALFALALIGSLFLIDKPENIKNAFLSAKPGFLWMAAGCMLVYWLLEAIVLYVIAKKMNSRLSFQNSFRTTMIGQLFNCITPFASGGQPVQAYEMNKGGISVGKASCVLLAKFIVYQLVLTLYSILLMFLRYHFFQDNVSRFRYLIVLGFAVNCFVMLMLISVGFFPEFSKKALYGLISLLSRIKLVKQKEQMQQKVQKELDAFYRDFQELRKKLGILIFPSLISAVQLTFYFTVPFFICLALNVQNPDFLSIISAAAFVLMISSFIPLPGGSGGAEGGFYILFSLFFPKAGIVAVTVLLWRIMTFYLPIVAGFLTSKIRVRRKLAE